MFSHQKQHNQGALGPDGGYWASIMPDYYDSAVVEIRSQIRMWYVAITNFQNYEKTNQNKSQ